MMTTKTGLQKLKKDRRDWSYHKTFGAAPLIGLPSEYLLLTPILDQGGINACTAFSAAAEKEAEFGIPFDPMWYLNKEALVSGFPNSSGYDLRVKMATGVKFGAKPLNGSEADADKYKDAGYYWIHGPYDIYDSVKSAMWNERVKKRTPTIGLMWYQDWLSSTDGMISDNPKNKLGLHDVKFGGWKIINGTEYAVIQNSFGTQYGDKGLFYFTREQVNKFFTDGQAIWSDNPEDPLSIKTISMLQDLLNALVNLLKSLNLWYNKQMPDPVIVPDSEPTIPPPAPPVQPTPPITSDAIKTIIADTAIANGVEAELALAVASCEGGTNIPNARNVNKGGSIDRGCFQWNNQYFPAITDAMADNPATACKLFCDAVKQGKLKTYWSASMPCWRQKVAQSILNKYNV